MIERKVFKRTVDLDKINDNEDEEEIEIDPETGLPVKKVVSADITTLHGFFYCLLKNVDKYRAIQE